MLSARRRRSLTALVLASFVGASLAAGVPGAAARPPSSSEVGHDPHRYTNPHAGYVAPPRGAGRLAPATGALLGTHSEDDHDGALTAEDQWILRTEEFSGRRMDINNSYYSSFDKIARNWEPGNPDKRGLSKLAYWDIEMGRIPLVGWACGRSHEIIRGDHDEVIRKTGEAFKALGADFFVRYCWEMDGSKRIEEGGKPLVGDPEDFIEAWRRIHDIIVNQVGATNVVWVWCGNAAHFKGTNDLDKFAWDYYPGDDVVDWVSADGYNWGASIRNQESGYEKDRWRGFVDIYDEFMVWARSTGAVPDSMRFEEDGDPTGVPAVFPAKGDVKPIMIGEYGVIQPKGDIADYFLDIAPYNTKQDWLRETHDTVNGDKKRTAECPWCGIFSDIAAMVYFDVEAVNGDWLLSSSPESEAAWREAAAAQPWFNQIHSLGWEPARNRPDVPAPGQTPPTTQPPTTQPPGNQPPGNQPPGNQPPRTQSPSVARSGYWMLGSDGKVFPFGEAAALGDAPTSLSAADVEPSPSGDGYWVVDSLGAVFAFGDALHVGGVSPGELAPGEVVTSLSATPSGRGYWLFTTRGRALAFGDALHRGDMAGVALNGPVLDSIPTPSGKGYYMVASDGGIFAFGDAAFYGSMGDVVLNAPVQSLVPDGDGVGYWLVASDGGVFSFEAPFRGSMGGTTLNRPVTGMVRFGNGYLMVAEDGGIFNFSDRSFHGSLGDNPPARPIVAVAPLEA